MTRARKLQVRLDETPYYHCINRCVRRAFLCGDDTESGKNFDHRKQWLVDKITRLSNVFAIDICAYSIMSNHYHLVLKVDKAKAEQWSDKDVALRWKQLFSGHLFVDRWLANKNTSADEKKKVIEIIQIWRSRLFELGWFMRCLNESIAVQANREDNCKGRFWEGRYKSQALLDEAALLACMTYVDLNPIRAGISETPKQSDFTSIKERITSLHEAKTVQEIQPETLSPFIGYISSDKASEGLPFKLVDYIELVDWTAKNITRKKSLAPPSHIHTIFDRFIINDKDWLGVITDFNRHYISAAGSDTRMKEWAASCQKKWCATHSSLKLYAH